MPPLEAAAAGVEHAASGGLGFLVGTPAPVPVPPPIRRGLRMAIRAQKLEILEPIVQPVAVDVMKLHV